MNQYEKAIAFRDLHQGPHVFILPNAWDVASALIFAQAGFPAIGTTSAGVAATLGYPDGEQIHLSELLPILKRMAERVNLPITADIEAGYGRTITAVAENVRAVIATGVVGINLEDAPGEEGQPLVTLARQARVIRAIRLVAKEVKVPLVINARTDVFWRKVGDPDNQLTQAVERANAYREAGADCLFLPGVSDRETIAKLVDQIRGPVNILAGPGAPSIPELERLGVARVSVGSGPIRAALALMRGIAQELLTKGTYTRLTEETIPYEELGELLARAGEL